jgi:hypothetical protein
MGQNQLGIILSKLQLKLKAILRKLLKPTRLKLITLIFLILLPISYFSGFGDGFKKNLVTSQSQSQRIPLNQRITISNLNFDLDNFELSNQVVIDSKPLKAPNNKQFLIIHFFVENPGGEPINLQAVNLFRLSDGKGRKFAPELYNKITTVLPQATKQDQVGFLVDNSESQMQLEFGDVNSDEKTTIAINK